jgi:hypothetical protein
MSFEIVNLVLSALGAVCLAGCLCVGLGWSV